MVTLNWGLLTGSVARATIEKAGLAALHGIGGGDTCGEVDRQLVGACAEGERDDGGRAAAPRQRGQRDGVRRQEERRRARGGERHRLDRGGPAVAHEEAYRHHRHRATALLLGVRGDRLAGVGHLRAQRDPVSGLRLGARACLANRLQQPPVLLVHGLIVELLGLGSDRAGGRVGAKVGEAHLALGTKMHEQPGGLRKGSHADGHSG
eukprot:scaffold108784_cov63-Phaeocystis_antarctica.AAC.2